MIENVAVNYMEPGIEFGRLSAEDVAPLCELIATTWRATYVETGLMHDSVVSAFFDDPNAKARVRGQIEAQNDPTDERLNYYLGAFSSNDGLVGAIKVARPFRDLNRQSGHESAVQRVRRKIGRQKPQLLNPSTAEVFELDVLPEYQREGIGTELVKAAVHDLHRDISYLQLYTHESGRGFYERFGFVATGESAGFPDREQGPLRFIHMGAPVLQLRSPTDA